MITSTMRALDERRGAVRSEALYDTDVDDLWQACTTPERLARWIAQVSGDLAVGKIIQLVFTSTWSGPARIDVCDRPHHLLLTAGVGAYDETQIEAWLTPEGPETRLVVEERGLPVGQLHFYGAGWQAHLEDLGHSLAAIQPVHPDGWSELTPAPGWKQRWTELTPSYRETAVGGPVLRQLSDQR